MSYANFMLPTMLLLGVGFALTFPSVNAQATNGVAEHEQGLASGLLNTSLQIGGAVMLAVVTAILSSSGAWQALPGQPLRGMTIAIGVIVAVTLTAFVLTLFQLRGRTSHLPAGADARMEGTATA